MYSELAKFACYRPVFKLSASHLPWAYWRCLSKATGWQPRGDPYGVLVQGEICSKLAFGIAPCCFSASERIPCLSVCSEFWVYFTTPIQAGVVMYMLYQLLGNSIFAGAGIMALAVPFSFSLGFFQKKIRMATMKIKDERIKMINETLSSIKVSLIVGGNEWYGQVPHSWLLATFCSIFCTTFVQALHFKFVYSFHHSPRLPSSFPITGSL